MVATTHSGDTSVVSALTRFDFEGNIMDQNSFADYVFGKSKTVVQTDSGFEIAGHRWSLDDNRSRGLELVKVNKELNFLDQSLIHYEINRTTNLPGILDIDEGSKVVYGSFIRTGFSSGGGAYLGLLNQETDSILSEVIFRGPGGFAYGSYSISDVQETVDSNMLFIAEVDLPGAGPGNGKHFEIVKFNWEGEILGKIESLKEGDNQAIVQDEQGDIYFYNSRVPFMLDTIDFGGSSNAGGISKINSEMDSVLWSFKLNDFDMLTDERGHTILGINQLTDGHLLAYGIAGYNSLTASERIGFICKFTKEGKCSGLANMAFLFLKSI